MSEGQHLGPMLGWKMYNVFCALVVTVLVCGMIGYSQFEQVMAFDVLKWRPNLYFDRKRSDGGHYCPRRMPPLIFIYSTSTIA